MSNKPEIYVDVFGRGTSGRPVPDAARFGVGAVTHADIERATEARRAQRPGDYRNDAPADLSRRYNQATNG